MMRKAIITLLALATLGASGCKESGVGYGTRADAGTGYTAEFWGEWLRVDTGDAWYISGDAITINGLKSPVQRTLNKPSERVVEVKDRGVAYYLTASRVANARFSGALAGIVENMPVARSTFANLAGMRLVVRNLYNTAQEIISMTDDSGNFTVEDAIPGDAYTVTPLDVPGAPAVTVRPQADGDDIGVITLGTNFKASVTPSATTNMSELYVNESYAFNLAFENIGAGVHRAPAYRLMPPAGVTVTGQTEAVNTGEAVEPGGRKSVLINVTCASVADDYEYQKIGIEMTNETGDEWEDSFSLRFYRESVAFNLRASNAVSGSITTPDANVYPFANTERETVTLPKLTTGEYMVVVSGTGEAVYSLGVGVEADGDFGSFSDTTRYEPNDTEQGAYVITTEKIVAALSPRGDRDYYRLAAGNLTSVLTSIAITPPTKTVYTKGEVLDLTGLVVTGTYSDGSTKTETAGVSAVTGYDPEAVGEQTLTVTVGDKTATFAVTVTPPILTSIAITSPPTKTVYTKGESLDLTGLVVTGTYSDTSTKTESVGASNITGFNADVIGEQTLTVTVGYKTATFAVTVTPPVLTSIAITSPPTKTIYTKGESLDLTGLVVTGTYSDESTKTEAVSLSAVTGYDPNAVGEQTLTITVEGKTATFIVNVLAVVRFALDFEYEVGGIPEDIVLSKRGLDGTPATATLEVAGTYASYAWYLNDTETPVSTTAVYTLNAADCHLGRNVIAVEAVNANGVYASKEITFTVTR
jgi:hypothetical protein